MHMHVKELALCLAFPYAETGAPAWPRRRRLLIARLEPP